MDRSARSGVTECIRGLAEGLHLGLEFEADTECGGHAEERIDSTCDLCSADRERLRPQQTNLLLSSPEGKAAVQARQGSRGPDPAGPRYLGATPI